MAPSARSYREIVRVAEVWFACFPLVLACAACNSGQTATLGDTGSGASALAGSRLESTGPAFAATAADVARAPDGAERSATGLSFRVLSPGHGKVHPLLDDSVKVNYVGWTRVGTQFYSSIERGQPMLLRVGDGIPAWREALPLMVAGEKRRLWAPSKLAYGDNAPVAPGDVVFDIELVGIAKPPPAPDDLAAPPPEARRTASGLAYRVLEAGSGSAHPTLSSRVTVDYSGWTPDGKMFDSSVARGQPALLRMDEVVKGFAEGVTLLVVGDTARLWVPAELAEDESSDAPFAVKGPVVFDVALLAID
jgi:FKBP-type peptidyl-prolyl cis-trans isomerase